MIKAFIFDKDGVVTDTEPLKAAAWKEVLSPYTSQGDKWYQKRGGISGYELVRLAIKEFDISENPWAFQEKRRRIFYQMTEKEIPVIDSTIEFLKNLRESYPNLKIGLATSETRFVIAGHLKKLGIENLFDVYVSFEEVERDKPYPDVYLEAAKRLKVSVKNCCGVEDSEAGVKAVKAAEMFCIGFQNPGSLKQDLLGAGADIVLGDLRELDLKEIISKI